MYAETIEIESLEGAECGTIRKLFSRSVQTRIELVHKGEVVAVIVTPEDAERLDLVEDVVARIASLKPQDPSLAEKARKLIGDNGELKSNPH